MAPHTAIRRRLQQVKTLALPVMGYARGAVGFFERSPALGVQGWCWSPGLERPRIVLLAGGEPIAEFDAVLEREDLRALPLMRHARGFAVDAPREPKGAVAAAARAANGRLVPLRGEPIEYRIAVTRPKARLALDEPVVVEMDRLSRLFGQPSDARAHVADRLAAAGLRLRRLGAPPPAATSASDPVASQYEAWRAWAASAFAPIAGTDALERFAWPANAGPDALDAFEQRIRALEAELARKVIAGAKAAAPGDAR